MHPWKRFWKVDVDAAYYWDEPLKLVEASEAEAALAVEQSLRKQSAEALDIAAKELGRLTDALAERDEGFKGFIEETERLHKAEVYGLKTLLAEAQAEADDTLLKADEEIKRLEAKLAAAYGTAERFAARIAALEADDRYAWDCVGEANEHSKWLEAEVARLKAQACHVVLEHPDWAFVCKHEPARPDADVVVVNAHTRQKPKRKRRRSK